MKKKKYAHLCRHKLLDRIYHSDLDPLLNSKKQTKYIIDMNIL